MHLATPYRAIIQASLLGLIWLGMTYVTTPEFLWGQNLWLRAAKNIIIIFAVTLINTSFLLPKVYFQKKILLYLILLIALFPALTVLINELIINDTRPLHPFGDPKFREMILEQYGVSNLKRSGIMPSRPGHLFRYFSSLPAFTLAAFVSNTVELTRYANTKEKENIALEKEKLVTEIKFLKAQINPHFLFNALNNIYTLTLTKSEDAPDNLLRLSEMLKYMVYDCSAKRVPIGKEIEYLKNYIALSSLKERSGLNIDVTLEATNTNLPIPPLLFIPFVENAFKHSNIEDTSRGWIKINLESGDNKIKFRVENSHAEVQSSKDSTGGIGLSNVRKRLELMYGKNFDLINESKDEKYIVSLIIDKV